MNEKFLAELVDLCKKYEVKLVGTCVNEGVNGEIIIMKDNERDTGWGYTSHQFYDVIDKNTQL